ncbi:DUF2254 domain-containing protein [Actinoplanes sp. NPDC026623]|uniref:DUF2254 domain-containing protein n=1 Tax=Actinoplanes sp. NPDC026623 TaxID=3155610 RepID=UPI0033C1D844
MSPRIPSRIRRRVFTDWLRTEIWPLPVMAVAAATGLAVLMPRLDARLLDDLSPTLATVLFSGGPEAARSVLQTVAGSLITVTSLTFSLTVVTLQLASGQYSPRLLRTFAQDRFVHAALAILLGTFAYALTVLRTVRGGDDDIAAFVPRLSVTVAYALTVVSVLTVVGFLAHLAQKIRVESMLRDVHSEGRRTIRHTMSPPGPIRRTQTPAGPGVVLCAGRSGFLASADEDQLLRAADAADVVISIDRLPGASVVAGTPVGKAWHLDGSPVDDSSREALQGKVDAALQMSFERTAAQDVAFGLRQITDVAVKALSPSVNDPTTAVHALGHASALLCEAARHDCEARQVPDGAGRTRVILARPSFASLLDLAVVQPRRYGAGEPEVLGRILRLLREVAWAGRGGDQDALLDQLARTRAVAARQDLDEVERSRLERDADLVETAVQGDWPHGA